VDKQEPTRSRGSPSSQTPACPVSPSTPGHAGHGYHAAMTANDSNPFAYFHDLFCEQGHPAHSEDVLTAVRPESMCGCAARREFAEHLLLEAERRATYKAL